MPLTVTVHLSLPGTAQAALEFYQATFGGLLTAVSRHDAGEHTNDDRDNDLLWGQLVAANGFRIIAQDRPANEPGTDVDTVAIHLRGQTRDEVSTYWNRLADGATVLQPMEPATWADLSGRLRDRFGVTWILDVGHHHLTIPAPGN
ncbi:VOC family protein [Nocardia takedensis]